ncbi:MAG: DUF1622 domain-containing protein [Bdellovibrionales bacterium]|nr:DUF1622 domain-containing protein [Bdellovibrionales bacterium]
MNLDIYNTIAIVVSVAGSFIIIWGVLVTLFYFLKAEYLALKGENALKKREFARFNFGTYLLLGLDFMLAADMLHTIHNPVLSELYVLGAIVAIRSVISFFLTREMKEANLQEMKDS